MEHQIKEFSSLIDLLEDLDREGIIGERRKWIVKDFLSLKARKNEIPYSGGFELTPLCNFDCKMCYVHLSKPQMKKEQELLTVEQWLDIVRQACDMGMVYADLTGGECLTYPGFKEIYLYLLLRGVRVSVLTNGSLITEELAELFERNSPEVVQISLYGSDDDAYWNVTGTRSFECVINAIKRLKRHGIRVRVSIMPHRYMQQDMLKLLDLIHSLEIPYIIGDVTLPARDNTGREMQRYIAETQLCVDIKVAERKYLLQRYPERMEEEIPYYFTYKGMADDGGIPCGSGRCSFHVNWRGELTPCVPFYMINESILNSSFENAWKIIRRKMKEYRLPNECKVCDLRDKCFACPAEKTYGVLNGPVNHSVCEKLRGVLSAYGRLEDEIKSKNITGGKYNEEGV